MLVDSNLLLYAVDERSPFHERSRAWLTDQLSGSRRVGLPWQSLVAFLRIITHSRASARPLTAAEAWEIVRHWLDQEAVWTPTPGDRHADILGGLIERHDVRGNVVGDAHVAALALEHGLWVYSADSDFARFPEVRWTNPLHA